MTNYLSDSIFKRYSDLIKSKSGIVFNDHNRSVLDNRIRAILQKRQELTIESYLAKIVIDNDELKHFLDSVTTNLTRFFRNESHTGIIEEDIIPQLSERKKKSAQRKIRIWSAGCSTGEEPYTLAMIFAEKLGDSFDVEIIASDISLSSLFIAKEGLYQKSCMDNVPVYYREKYFTQTGENYLISDSLKKMVTFDYHNLINLPVYQQQDFVICRNVMIYLSDKTKKDMINNFYNAMNKEAFLVIGHSESLFGLSKRFEFVRSERGSYYEKK